MKPIPGNPRQLLAPATALALFTSLAHGDIYIYEPFDYASTGIDEDGAYLGDGSQSGALGLDGAWSQMINNIEMEVVDGGLNFTDAASNPLPVSGNSILRSSREGFTTNSISVQPSATAALTADNTTMWMSILYIDTGFSGPDSAVMLASEELALANNHALSAAGYGVGILIGESSPGINATVETGYYLNTTTTTRAQSTVNPNDAEGTAFLLAAKINWMPDGTPDEIYLFNITDLTAEPAEGDAIATDTFDMPLTGQQALDTLNIGETQIDGFDEIRFGTNFVDVIGGAFAAKASFALKISPNAGTPGNYDFTWESKGGFRYDLVSSTDLSIDPDSWPVWDSRVDITGTAPESMLTDVPGGGDPGRFFAVIEKAPLPLLDENFDAAAALPADWASNGPVSGTDWEVGDPTDGFASGPSVGASSPSNCAGTNIATNDGEYTDSTDVSLTTPSFAVPVGSGATLSFQYFIDTDQAGIPEDVGSVRVLDADNSDTPIAGLEIIDITGNGVGAAWTGETLELPAVDIGGKNLKIEFRFVSNDNALSYGGFYVDNVLVEVAP